MSQPHRPASTYRLQLSRQFTFSDARAVVPYLAELGITDAYTSPLLQSRLGSTHGYDICDHSRLDPALGSRQDFEAYIEALRGAAMGLLVDIVPNHMGLDVNANHWWRDVLQHGPSSPFARFFDIDWDPVTPELKGRILLPLLQDSYGEALHRGDLVLAWDGRALHVRYGDLLLPIEPRSAAGVLGVFADQEFASWAADGDLRKLADLTTALRGLPPFDVSGAGKRHRRYESAVDIGGRIALLARHSPEVRTHIESSIGAFNGVAGQPQTFDRLHALLEDQVYRLAHWRTAFDEINYRRFFDVNDLGALRMEDPQVFEATHGLIRELIETGMITGVRVDHPDGLFDPAMYFQRLRALAPASPRSDSLPPLHIVVEKILAPDEVLPDDWPVAGTTGYGFLAVVNGQFVDRANERQIRTLYQRVTKHTEPFAKVAYDARRFVMGSSMASELTVLARALKRIASAERLTRDFTLNALRLALLEVIACFPLYRTYVNETRFSAADLRAIDLAIDRAMRRNRTVPSSIFLFLRTVLLSTDRKEPEDSPGGYAARRTFAMKFQQFTAPVHAKGIEDTAYYRYAALISLNEVGGDPGRFGYSIDEFHEGNRVRLERWPLELIASSTHDTKRGEDARARLNVISEIPQQWRRAVAGWLRINGVRRTAVDREPAPERRDEYLFYQSLAGMWPAEPADAPIPAEAPAAVVERMQQFMHKAVKEAKAHTSWVNPNPAYEDAMAAFINAALTGTGAHDFLGSFVPFVRWLSARGVVNSLAQLVLKICSPGVADFYQGSEFWNLDLADPDNRRPVDFTARQAMLGELMPWMTPSDAPGAHDDLASCVSVWLNSWPDARIKMFVTACGIRLRREHADLFLHGAYHPAHADGAGADHIIGFAREHEGQALIAVVPRLTVQIASGWPIGASTWDASRIILPAHYAGRSFRNVLTGEDATPAVETGRAWLPVAEVLRVCPVAMLWS